MNRRFCQCTAVITHRSGAPTVGLSGDAPLGVCSQTFTQPHLFPGGIRNGIAKPAMGNLMNDVNQQELTTFQDGGNDEGKAGVFHGNNGKGGGQEHDITPASRAISHELMC